MSIKNWLDFGGDPVHIALELGHHGAIEVGFIISIY